MIPVEYFFWWLPPGPGRKKPYLSSWKMNATEAAQREALRLEPGSREVRQQPETDEERRRLQVNYQSAGMDGAMPPRK